MPFGAFISLPSLAISVVSPLIPLGLLLAKKGNAIRQSTFLLGLLLSVNLVSGMFIHISAKPSLQGMYIHISLTLQIIFSSLLLRGCTNKLLLQQIILTSISIYAASNLTFLLILPEGDFSILIRVGFGVVFILSILVLLSFTNNSSSLLFLPEFWFAGGIFFLYGLFSIMLTMPQFLSLPINDHSSETYTSICYLIQTLLFCGGIAIQKK